MPTENLNQDPSKPGFIDLYAFFKISNKATNAEIDKSFRKMSMTWHPDKNKNNPEATQVFVKISAWRDLLKDSEKRTKYDANLAWFKNGKKGPQPGKTQEKHPSSDSYAPYSDDTGGRSPYEYTSAARGTPEHSTYEPPPWFESRVPSDNASDTPRYAFQEPSAYAPRCESREPSDYTPRYEPREPSDYMRARTERRQGYPSSRPREDAESQCQCPDCVPPPGSPRRREDSYRQTRSTRMYEEPPRFESRATPGHRPSRRQEEREHRSSYRSTRLESPGMMMFEEIIEGDDFDELFFEYEARSRFDSMGNLFLQSDYDLPGRGLRRRRSPRSNFGFY